jgi:hypothetical protein
MKVQYYLLLLKLLQIGIPYDNIKEMDEEEILYIIAASTAVEEKQNKNG